MSHQGRDLCPQHHSGCEMEAGYGAGPEGQHQLDSSSSSSVKNSGGSQCRLGCAHLLTVAGFQTHKSRAATAELCGLHLPCSSGPVCPGGTGPLTPVLIPIRALNTCRCNCLLRTCKSIFLSLGLRVREWSAGWNDSPVTVPPHVQPYTSVNCGECGNV